MDKERPNIFDIIEDSFGTALGATEVAYREKITLFIAHKNRNGDILTNIQEWIERAESILSTIGGGATSIKVRGAWMSEKDSPLYEDTTLVYCYAPPQTIFNAAQTLRDFLYWYGRETNQGEVVVSLENPDGDWFFRILPTKYNL